jgi:hypothetical protein
MIDHIKDVVQDCNINFLIGSGLSMPYLSVLGNIEDLLTNIEASEFNDDEKKLLTASVQKEFFDSVIEKNLNVVDYNDKCKDTEYIKKFSGVKSVLDEYKRFLTFMTKLILLRKSSLLSKQVNLFTTNIDVFFERALEDLKLDFNDGFKGRFNPVYDLNEFKKSYIKRSSHYDNISEIPLFNLLKIHGSLTWKIADHNNIVFSNLSTVKGVKKKTGCYFFKLLSMKEVVESLKEKNIPNDYKLTNSINDFLKEYKKLAIVNPTKRKFEETVMNQTYYELLRIYCNELEKENTVLFVMGFSMADEHIRSVTIRAANSNPTLKIFIICYNLDAQLQIQDNLEDEEFVYSNIEFLLPKIEAGGESFGYSFKNINKHLFGELFKKVNSKSDKQKHERV